MDTRKVAALMIAYAAALAAAGEELSEGLEKLMSSDKDGEDTPARSRPSRAKGKDKDADPDPDDGDDDPSEALIKKAREALKVCDKADVLKAIKKHGKADRASEVAEKYAEATTEALQELIDNAD